MFILQVKNGYTRAVIDSDDILTYRYTFLNINKSIHMLKYRYIGRKISKEKNC